MPVDAGHAPERLETPRHGRAVARGSCAVCAFGALGRYGFLVTERTGAARCAEGRPQPITLGGLKPFETEWKEENPYRETAEAVAIGDSGYNQDCFRCRGLQTISGGLAPDLRYRQTGRECDESCIERRKHGAVIDRTTKMPAPEGTLCRDAVGGDSPLSAKRRTGDRKRSANEASQPAPTAQGLGCCGAVSTPSAPSSRGRHSDRRMQESDRRMRAEGMRAQARSIRNYAAAGSAQARISRASASTRSICVSHANMKRDAPPMNP